MFPRKQDILNLYWNNFVQTLFESLERNRVNRVLVNFLFNAQKIKCANEQTRHCPVH